MAPSTISKHKTIIYRGLTVPETIDKANGTSLVDIHNAAVEMVPEIGAISLGMHNHAVAMRGAVAKKDPRGLDYSFISVPFGSTYWREITTDPLFYDHRAPMHIRQIMDKGQNPIPETINFTYAHELGHVYDFAQKIKQCSGDAKKAFEWAAQEAENEKRKSPLKGVSPHEFKRRWDENIDGYRDSIIAEGMTEEDFMNRLRAKAKETSKYHRQMLHEAVADRFALGVLATLNAR